MRMGSGWGVDLAGSGREQSKRDPTPGAEKKKGGGGKEVKRGKNLLAFWFSLWFLI